MHLDHSPSIESPTSAAVDRAPTTALEAHRDEALDRLLDDALGFDPVARGGFINHLPMSLVAARRLGADDATLQDWFDRQTRGDFLVPRDRPDGLDEAARRIDARGIAEEVRERLPAVVHDPFSQFFHAPIRVELAVNAAHAGQVADALRNWEAHVTPEHELGAHPGGEEGDLDFATVMGRVASRPEARAPHLPPAPEVAASRWFRAELERLRLHDQLLDEVEAFTLSTHARPRDFGTLHLVTGTRAARSLIGLLDANAADRLSWATARAVASAYLAFGSPAVADDDEWARRQERTIADWGVIGRRAVASRDPHVAKLVYACLLGSTRTGDVRYRIVAGRQVGV
jgi:hypothetical protein